MPYITKSERGVIDKILSELVLFVKTKGQYNYAISKLLHQFIISYRAEFDGQSKNSLCYDACNDVIGILECIKHELYATVIRPYEQQKKKDNGHISVLDL